jgi:O-antigen/teichoic acid export membrane protein
MADDLDAARAGLRSVTRGTLVMVVGSLGLVAETFVSRVLLTHWLSQSDWNAFSLGLALAGLLSTFGSLGLPQAVARNLPYVQENSERRGIVRAGFRFLLPGALVAGGALSVGGLAISSVSGLGLLGETLLFLGVAVFASILSGLLASYFQGFEETLPNALFNQVLTPGLFIVFLFAAWGVGGFHLALPVALGGYVASSVASLLMLTIFARRRLPRFLPAGPWAAGVRRKLLLFALPLLAVGVLSYATGYADTLILGVFHAGRVGLYVNQLTLARLLQVGLGSLGFIFLPVAARFARERRAASVRLIYATATKWTLLTSLPLFLIFFFFPGESMGFVFGPLYTSSPDSLRIAVAGGFVACLLGPANTALVSYGQIRLLVYNTVASAVTNGVLSLWLVPGYGTTGAAVAWAASNALFAVLSAAEIATFEQVHPFLRDYLVPTAATLLPLALVFAILPRVVPLWTLPAFGLGAALWFVLAVLLTRSIGPGDAMLLDSMEGILGLSFPLLRRVGRWGSTARQSPR